jgi:hypothetical protein
MFWEFGAFLLRVKWPQHQAELLPRLGATRLYVVYLVMSVIQTIHSIEKEKTDYYFILHPYS